MQDSVITLCLLFLCTCLCPSGADIPSTPSPCPGVFIYDMGAGQTDRWYANITLVTDVALTGFWLDIVLDRKAHLLGNNMAPTVSSDNKVFTIQNLRLRVLPETPPVVRIFVKYGEGEPPPIIETIRLNGRVICSSQHQVIVVTPQPISSTELRFSDTPQRYPQTTPRTINFERPRPQYRTTETPTQPPPAPYPDADDSDDYWSEDITFIRRVTARKPTNTASWDERDCGVVAAQPSPLISGGQVAARGQWPWHAALFRSIRGGKTEYLCGGTLISKRAIVTAAHCVTRTSTTTPINPQTLVVHLGKHDLDRSLEGEQIVVVRKIIVHSDYNSSNFRADVAILQLSTEITYTDLVRYICLWDPRYSSIETVVGKSGTVAGWGIDETRRITENLSYVRMPVVTPLTCIDSYPEFFSRFISDTTYCAGFKNGTSVCNGDSGGGMAFHVAIGDRPDSRLVWRLRGVVSVGVALQNDFACDVNHYVMFTDLAQFVSWLREHAYA